MLTATDTTFSRKQFAFLGKIFLQKEPEIAGKLIEKYLPKSEASEKDLTKIPAYYISFCKVQGINPQDFIGPLHKTSKVNVRRTFIAVILHIYAQHLFLQSSEVFVLDDVELSKTNLSKSLADLFLMKKPNISKMIREVVMWEKQYEDFSNSVNSIIEKLADAAQENKY